MILGTVTNVDKRVDIKMPYISARKLKFSSDVHLPPYSPNRRFLVQETFPKIKKMFQYLFIISYLFYY